MDIGRWVRRGLVAVAVIAVAIQVVPYGRDHSNPPATGEPAWDSEVTRELAVRACFDCHSNETEWPWYSTIAPVSWLVQRDVEEGRDELNWSEWDGEQEGEEAAETIREGSMPPRLYLVTHPDARLDESQMAALEAGLATTFGEDDGDRDDERDGEREDDD